MPGPPNPVRSDRGSLAPEFAAYVSWDGLRARMSESARSAEGRAAGIWAVDVLRDQLGHDWMERVALAEGRAPSDLLLSMVHAVAFGDLLDLALRLHLLRNVEGMAVVRRDLKNDLREQRRLHTRVLLNVAALALQRGHGVAMEKRVAVDLAPTDVVITTPSGNGLMSETFAVLTDDELRRSPNLNALQGSECLRHEVVRLEPKRNAEKGMRRLRSSQLRRSGTGLDFSPIAPESAPISTGLRVTDEAKSSILAGEAWWAVEDSNL